MTNSSVLFSCRDALRPLTDNSRQLIEHFSPEEHFVDVAHVQHVNDLFIGSGQDGLTRALSLRNRRLASLASINLGSTYLFSTSAR